MTAPAKESISPNAARTLGCISAVGGTIKAAAIRAQPNTTRQTASTISVRAFLSSCVSLFFIFSYKKSIIGAKVIPPPLSFNIKQPEPTKPRISQALWCSQYQTKCTRQSPQRLTRCKPNRLRFRTRFVFERLLLHLPQDR